MFSPVYILYKHTFLPRFVRMCSHSEYFNYTSIYTCKTCLLALQRHLKDEEKKYIVLSCYIYIRLHVSSMYTCTVTRKGLSPSAVDKILFCSSAVAILFDTKKIIKGVRFFHRCLYSFIIKRSG